MVVPVVPDVESYNAGDVFLYRAGSAGDEAPNVPGTPSPMCRTRSSIGPSINPCIPLPIYRHYPLVPRPSRTIIPMVVNVPKV